MTNVSPSVVIETPPHLWRTQTLFIEKPCCSRNTPTTVENTIHHQCYKTSPHIYEEHHITVNKRSKKLRITPKSVGNTILPEPSTDDSRNHPRTRREYWSDVKRLLCTKGPLPRPWEIPNGQGRLLHSHWITPTPVRNIRKDCHQHYIYENHPRIYGEYKPMKLEDQLPLESPPTPVGNTSQR